MDAVIRSYRDLIVWQRAMDLVVAIYSFTADFPASEQFGLTSQIRRAAASIPANIAEGKSRSGRAEFRHFLSIAFASGAELETHLEITERLSFGSMEKRKLCIGLLLEVQKMLNVLLSKFRKSL